jgi:muramoyltetrapeptide carboxypeptidase
MGTPWELRCEGCLLLLEDVGEPPYTLDRYLTQLALGGHLEAAAGFVVGELVDCGRPEEAPTAREVVAERLAGFGKPCLANLPLGHGRYKLTVPLGVRAELDATAGSLTFVEPALC